MASALFWLIGLKRSSLPRSLSLFGRVPGSDHSTTTSRLVMGRDHQPRRACCTRHSSKSSRPTIIPKYHEVSVVFKIPAGCQPTEPLNPSRRSTSNRGRSYAEPWLPSIPSSLCRRAHWPHPSQARTPVDLPSGASPSRKMSKS